MEKNQFLVINDLIYDMYSWNSLDDIKENVFQRLKLIVPFSYASILLNQDPASAHVTLYNPICYPEAFLEAEEAYLAYEPDADYMMWNLYAKESKLLRSSAILDEQTRLNSPLYMNCYRKFDVYDDMQFTIVHEGKLLGLLTLYRTSIDGAFTTDDMFFIRALGMHLNAVMHRILSPHPTGHISDKKHLDELKERFHLTGREAEILSHLYLFESNAEIADALGIRENTLQKHLQNLFRKLNVTSKWEVLRL
ncbi:MAG: LuxR C-terminal-related transcriptional regulator [Fusicatenibacter sp.]|nr:LuxR C-terminal-related transcriptional regulator [Lachnospiraceae bacterium]MDY2938353.1 LuxR C-terminal-related transcriptional regulator [Fusicatenibacter sp.]